MKSVSLSRQLGRWLALAWLCSLHAGSLAAQQQPMRYEIAIDGEEFNVEGNRLAELKSKSKPGTTYRVAVRPAQYQFWRLNTLQFSYHSAFSVDDDQKTPMRTATCKHPAGFVMVVTDFGAPLPPENRAKSRDLLVNATRNTLERSGATQIEVDKPSRKKFGNTTVEGLMLRYRDSDKAPRACLVYLITGEQISGSCVVQCTTADVEDVMPLIGPTVESFKPI